MITNIRINLFKIATISIKFMKINILIYIDNAINI